MKLTKDFSKVVKHAMIERDSALKEVSLKTGIPQQRLSSYLHGHARWNEDAMRQVCDALNIRIIYEITEDERGNTENAESVRC